MTKLPATTIVCEIVSTEGTAAWHDPWAGPGHRTFQATPPHVFADFQPGPIPITVNHDGPVVGHITYLESGMGYGNGGIYGVGVVDGIPAPYIDELVMCSPVIAANAMARTINTTEFSNMRMKSSTKMVGNMHATRAEVHAVGLVDRTAGVTSTRVRAWDGSYITDASMMKACRVPEIINRAIDAAGYDLRYRQPAQIKIHRPPEGAHDIEIRKASTLEVRWAQRTIDLIVVPYNESTEVIIDGKWVTETIAPGAFDGYHADVTVNRAHNLEEPLGRVTALHPEDPRGLRAELRISRTASGDDVLELAADALLGASVGFRVLPGGEQRAMDQRARTITRAELVHIALTGDPAYKGAKVLAVRSL